MIKIKCFAIIKDIVGEDEIDIRLSELEEASIQGLWSELEKRYEGLKGKGKYLRFSKNLNFVQYSEILEDGDVVGIIPPVAGG